MFSVQQINNLLTGIVLAAELESDKPGLRKFLVMDSFQLDESGRRKLWDKKIKKFDKADNAIFDVRCYSLTSEDMENYLKLGYEIESDSLTEDIVIKDIVGWDNLYKALSQFTDDVSILQPQWQCDNPLEPGE